jgi:TatD DNase family protein
MTYPIIDSHCHLDADDFDNDREAVLSRARDNGVQAIVLPGTDLASSRKALRIVADQQTGEQPKLFAAVGIHPHTATEGLDDEAFTTLRDMSRHERVVAIGETGLDFHYNFSPPEAQLESLRRHVRLAREVGKPLILHCRNAEPELLDVLTHEQAATCGGVVHCYTGTQKTAERLLGMGFYLGFTGIVTFKKAEELREVAARVPLDRLLLETDSPYLAPIPHRGKRNEPSFLPRVAEMLAPLHATTAAELAAAALRNTVRCFNLPLS